mmetsp:Transcript_4845/g.17016  ORF Transcript_4845/g.17016 Transcript_4845/m.17016 type:complete len:629 (+) Transcript_4845:974-2860(+)
MPDAGGQQRDVVLVAALDRVAVPDASSRVDDGLDPGLAGLLHRVVPREWEEGVAGHDGALDLVRGLLDGDLDALYPVRLARAHPEEPLPLGDGDGVRLDVLDAAPRELEVLKLLLGRLLLRHDLELDVLGGEVVVLLQDEAAADLLQALAVALVVRRGLQYPQGLGLPLEDLEPLLRVPGGDHDLVEHPGLAVLRGTELPDLPRQVRGDGPVEGYDSTKGAHGVGLHGPPVGLPEVVRVILTLVGAGHAAGVGVLDDHARGLHKVADARVRRVAVQKVVEAHLLPVVLGAERQPPSPVLREGVVDVESGLLVRVLAVPERVHQPQRHGLLRWGVGLLPLRPPVLPKPLRDVRVVAGDVLEGLPRQVGAQGLPSLGIVARECVEDARVVRWVDNDGDVLVVLRGGPDEGGATDVDLLDGILEGDVLAARHGGPERVKVADHHVNETEVLALHGLHVVVQVPPGQDPTVDGGVQGLDSAIEHLRKVRNRLDLGDRDAALAYRPKAPSRAHDLVPEVDEAAREVDDPALVRHGHEHLSPRPSHVGPVRRRPLALARDGSQGPGSPAKARRRTPAGRAPCHGGLELCGSSSARKGPRRGRLGGCLQATESGKRSPRAPLHLFLCFPALPTSE